MSVQLDFLFCVKGTQHIDKYMIEVFTLPVGLWMVRPNTQFVYFCQLTQLYNEVTIKIQIMIRVYAI